MLRKLALAVATAGSLYSAPAMALGLGSIQLESAQNEPLQAEIVVNDVDGLTLGQIQPELADNDDFQRAGVERFFFLSNLKFEPFIDEEGQTRIRVTTSQPVVEPYLSFLVELNWPTGRLLKEYTVLLDPPNVAGKTTLPEIRVAEQGASDGEGGDKEIENSPTITTTETKTTATGSQPVRQEELAADEYRIENGDTLWVIARDNRPQGVTINQTMVAIQTMNPDAFLNGNINLIKSGSLLNLPSADEVRQYAATQADQLVAEQNRAFDQPEQAPIVATQPTDAEPIKADQSGDGRLEVVSETDPDESRVEQLENDLAISQDETDRLSRQNELLSSRIEELEKSLADMQRLIELQSETGAMLAEQATPTPTVEGEVVNTATPAPEVTPQATVTPEATPEATAQVSATPTATPVAAPVASLPEPAPTLVDKVMGWLTASVLNLVIVGLGAFVVIAGVVVAISRRRQEENLDDIEAPEDDVLMAQDEAPAVEPEVESEPQVGDDADSAEEDSPFSNTDMYLAFGHFDQAMDELDAVEGRGVASHLVDEKRLEVLAEAGLRERFDVVAHRVDLSHDRLTELQEKLAENESAPLDEATDVDVSMDFDEAPTPEPLTEGVDLTEDQLDFSFEEENDSTANDTDLAFDFEEEDEVGEGQSAETLETDAGDDLSLDFDLGEDSTPASDTTESLSLDDELADELDFQASQPEWQSDVDTSDNTSLDFPDFASESGDVDEQVPEAELDAGLDFADLGDEPNDQDEQLPEGSEPIDEASPSQAPSFDALSEDFQPQSEESGSELDDDFGILSSADEFGTKLDLARAYIDMEDVESAKDILQEVIVGGDADQQAQAQSLLEEL